LLSTLKVFLLKRGFLKQAFALALIVASLASAYSLANFVNLQAESLGSYVPSAGEYILFNGSTPSESLFNASLAELVRDAGVSRLSLQRLFKVNVSASSCTFEARVRAVDDVGSLLGGCLVSGSHASGPMEVEAGELLAGSVGLKAGENVSLILQDGRALNVKVSGVFRSNSQLDSELVSSLSLSEEVFGDSRLSLIQLYSEDASKLVKLLPEGFRLARVQASREFVEGLSLQTSTFLHLWSAVACALIAAASYTISSRIIVESEYEVGLLKALGAGGRLIHSTVFLTLLFTALSASILGVSLGLVVAQAASWALSFTFPGMPLQPFLEPLQALSITLLTVSSSAASYMFTLLTWRPKT